MFDRLIDALIIVLIILFMICTFPYWIHDFYKQIKQDQIYAKQQQREGLLSKLDKHQKEIGKYILLAKADPKTKELLDQLLEIDRKFHAS